MPTLTPNSQPHHSGDGRDREGLGRYKYYLSGAEICVVALGDMGVLHALPDFQVKLFLQDGPGT